MIITKNIFKKLNILIIGDIILDEFEYYISYRNSPEYLNTPIVIWQSTNNYLGGAANVALNCIKMGASATLIGFIGNDEHGKMAIKMCSKHKINTKWIVTSKNCTTHKKRVFINTNPCYRNDTENTIYLNKHTNKLIKNIKESIAHQEFDAIILQDYNKGVLSENTIPKIIKIAQQNKLPIFVDPKFENWKLYKNCTCVKPNINEINYMATTLKISNVKIKLAIQSVYKIIKPTFIITTIGKYGNYIFDGKKMVLHKQETTIAQADVCGAGDSVIAIITLAYLRNFTLSEIGKITNIVGAIACSHQHIYPVSISNICNTTNIL